MAIDCQKLNQEINELEEELESISEEVQEFAQSEEVGKVRLVGLDQRISELEARRDEVFEAHLGEFSEKLPELWDAPFCVDLPVLKDEYGREVEIGTKECLSGTEILVEGNQGRLMKILTKRDGEWVYEDAPEFKGKDGKSEWIGFVKAFSKREKVFVVGMNGTAKILTKRDGEWVYEDAPEFTDKNGDVGHISNTEEFFEGELLVGGYSKDYRVKESKILSKTGGKWEYKDVPEIRDENGDIVEIGEFALLSDTLAFIADVKDGSGLRMRFLERKDGKIVCESVPEFRDKNGNPEDIYSGDILSETDLCLLGEHGTVKILSRTGDGKWEYRDIPEVKDENGRIVNISGVERLSEGKAFVEFEDDGGARILKKTEDGQWIFEDDIPKLRGKDGEETETINRVLGLSGDEIFIQSSLPPKILRRVNGRWEYIDVTGIDEGDGWYATRMSDTEVFVETGEKGAGKILECPKIDLEMLKRNLSKIKSRSREESGL